MTSARLLAAALLFYSLSAFTQDRQTVSGNGVSALVTNGEATATPSEPWRVIPNAPDFSSNSADRIRVDQYRLDRGQLDPRPGRPKMEAQIGGAIMGDEGSMEADAMCYAIRSYVVARDSRDSDSTHPVDYSTCRRASRYHLKTTVGESVPLQPELQR
jgi:hypothetical protein